MKKQFILLLLLVFSVIGCSPHYPADTITQASTIDLLLAGQYDGQMTCEQLLGYGNFGIGTFDRLDGEMILLDGAFYQVKSDGQIYRPDMTLKTPFAAVSHFAPDTVIALDCGQGLNDTQLRQTIDTYITNPHLFYAIRINGRFESMHTRSVPSQQKPYPPLSEVTKNQPEFEMKDIAGTIVGFWCPAYTKGINVPGYHLHFISDDFKQGGHILGFEMRDGQAEIDCCHQFALIMPEEGEGLAGVDLSVDRSGELNQVEHLKVNQ